MSQDMTHNTLPEQPDEIIRDIKASDAPVKEAFRYARALISLTEPEKKDFWYKSELNLLATILLYVAKAESFVPVVLATGCLVPDAGEERDGMRTAAEVINCIEDPVTFRLIAVDATRASRNDMKLLKYGLNAYMVSKVRDNIASNLAVESEIIEYLTYGR